MPSSQIIGTSRKQAKRKQKARDLRKGVVAGNEKGNERHEQHLQPPLSPAPVRPFSHQFLRSLQVNY